MDEWKRSISSHLLPPHRHPSLHQDRIPVNHHTTHPHLQTPNTIIYCCSQKKFSPLFPMQSCWYFQEKRTIVHVITARTGGEARSFRLKRVVVVVVGLAVGADVGIVSFPPNTPFSPHFFVPVFFRVLLNPPSTKLSTLAVRWKQERVAPSSPLSGALNIFLSSTTSLPSHSLHQECKDHDPFTILKIPRACC